MKLLLDTHVWVRACQIAIEAYRLPKPFHRDLADRQIVACARLHEMSAATADERILG